MEIIIDKKYNSLFENEDALVMQKEIEEIIMKSTWIIDTPELRSKINSEIEKLLCPYLREKKLNYLLELSDEIDSPSQKK